MKNCLRQLLIVALPLLCQFIMHSQSTLQYTEVKNGQTVPTYTLQNMLNYSDKTVRLSDFAGKMLVLDFWNTHCLACVASWPHLLEMQKKYASLLQIVLVDNIEDDKVVKKTIERMNRSLHIQMNLPVSCGIDTTIEQLFPYESVPHIIWIDKNGRLQTVTSGWEFNPKTIEAAAVSNYASIESKPKPEERIHVIANKPLFIDSNGGKPEKVLWQSIFARTGKNIAHSYGLGAPDKSNHYYASMLNCDIRTLFALAYSNRESHIISGLDRLPNSNILLDVADTSHYVAYIDEELVRENLFTYQLIPPGPISQDLLQQYMQSDLARYLGLKVYKEKRLRKCLVLSMDDSSKVMYESGHKKFGIVEDTLHINKLTVPALIDEMQFFVREYFNSPYPLVDETNYKGELGGISVPDGNNSGSYEVMNKGLEKYKMHLRLELREFEFLVIEEPPHYVFPYK